MSAHPHYHDPEVLVLDEATSALDHETERAVMEAVEHLRGSRTILLIAHRLTTVETCAEVIHVEGGRTIPEPRWFAHQPSALNG